MRSDVQTSPKHLWGFRIGRLLQLAGLILGLEALFVFGPEPHEGPMIYLALAAVAVFYLGWWLARRFGPQPGQKK